MTKVIGLPGCLDYVSSSYFHWYDMQQGRPMSPFLITPLYPLEHDPRVIHRMVKSASLGEGDVETVLWRENGSLSVVVRDRDTVHCSMTIDDASEAVDDEHRMCWANFEEMHHSILCVLATPTRVHLWDSTSFLGGGEGISIHLPCEATSIFPLQTGILVQRRHVADDHDENEDDEMDFLSKPEVMSSQMASLFSCTHPLKTVLPVANSSILNQVIFVGVITDVVIAVSYHAELRRYSVWVLDNPPTSESYEAEPQSWDLYTETPFMVEESFLRGDGTLYQGYMGGNSSQKEALADALGVGSKQIGDTLMSTPSMLNGGLPPLYPDLSMTLLYEASSIKALITKKIFLADNFLCILTETELQIWTILNRQLVQMAAVHCICAIPIKCEPSTRVPPKTYILVISTGIQLFYGGRYVADVTFGANAAVRALHDSVANRFTLELLDGMLLRAALRLTLTPLVERVFSALRAAVGEEIAMLIRLDTVRLNMDFANSTVQDPCWLALCYIVKQLFGSHTAKEVASEVSSWNQLLQSGYHANYQEGFPFFGSDFVDVRECDGAASRASSMQSLSYMAKLPNKLHISSQIFDAIHLLYEDFKLSILTRPYSRAVRSLLRSCTTDLMQDFASHYQKDTEGRFDATRFPSIGKMERRTTFSSPPCIMSWIVQCISNGKNDCVWKKQSEAKSICSRLELVQRVFSVLASNLTRTGLLDIRLDEAVVQALLEGGVEDPKVVLDDFPLSISLLLFEVLTRCRYHPLTGESLETPSKTWKLIGREDMLLSCPEGGHFYSQMPGTIGSAKDDPDGLIGIEATHALRFPADNRLKEVARLLRSSRPSFLKVPRAIELSDHDYERLKQERLLTLCRRVLALPLGRGMFTLGTLNPLSAEQLPIPDLCLSGRVPPTNTSVALDVSQAPADMTMWPDFHNGVAAGLRLPTCSKNVCFTITRSWIIYNKVNFATSDASEPRGKNEHAHAGFLMALGLRGHLSALSMTDVYEYLTQGSITTSVGMLLGMAANKRGTCDPSVSKMLCLHIPSLLPLSFSSIDVSPPAHAAAVAGIGLLYQGSSHRLMTEFLLNEMGRRPVHDSSTIDREAYALSCGLALGMITLAKGGSGGNAGLADLEIEQRLYRYIVGGLDDRASRRRQDLADRRVNTNGGAGGDGERCARVYEGATINNDVSAPGALLALGLMYMKSSNKVVAAILAIPDTHFLLEYSRPDTLMLRVLARSLILWDEVQPTGSWIEEQIPSVVLRSFLKIEAAAKKASETARGVNDRTVEESRRTMYDLSKSHPDAERRQSQRRFEDAVDQMEGADQDIEGAPDVDRQTVRQMHAYLVAGSCFSMGLRFAGTGNPQAASAITKVVFDLKSFRDSTDPIPIALRPDQPIVETCLGLCSVSLALVMAGTGDLDTLRLFKSLHWRADEGVRYGTHMAISAAIGLLFLGGGMCTVGHSPEHVIALVAAFFPRFPMDSTDNKYHLQAMRHLYVLAVKQRHIQAFDVDSNESVSVLVEAHFNDSRLQPIHFTTPNLLINNGSDVERLIVQSGAYFRRTLPISGASSDGICMYVKKRPDGSSEPGFGSSCHRFAYRNGQAQVHSLLTKELRGNLEGVEIECNCKESARPFCNDAVFGCITQPLPHPSLPVLGIMRSKDPARNVNLAWDIAILNCYYERLGAGEASDQLITPSSVALILEKMRRLQGHVHPRYSDSMAYLAP